MRIRWFGQQWPSSKEPAPICEDDAYEVNPPAGQRCVFCPDEIEARERGVVMAALDGDPGVFYLLLPDVELTEGTDRTPIVRRRAVCAAHIDCLMRNALGPDFQPPVHRVPDADLRHFLLVHGRDEETGKLDWEVEHDLQCPTEARGFGTFGVVEVPEYSCQVGYEVAHSGIDSLDLPDDFAPGTYRLAYWFQPGGGAGLEPVDTDGGLEIVGGRIEEGSTVS